MQVIENIGGEYRNRTGVHGFAIRCVTTPPTRRQSSERRLSDHLELRKRPRAGNRLTQALFTRGFCVKTKIKDSERKSLADD